MDYRMKNNKVTFVIFLIIWISITCIGQNVYYEQYTDADGLPSMTAYEMVQDSNGILWIGTENGLVSYDGEEFITYTHPNLKDNDIIEVVLGKDGTIMFFNLSHQLGKIVDEKIQILLTGGGLNYNLISSETNDYILEKQAAKGSLIYRIYELQNGKLDLFSELKTILESTDKKAQKESSTYSGGHPKNRIFYMLDKDLVLFFKHSKRFSTEEKRNQFFRALSFDSKQFSMKKAFFFATSEDRLIGLLPNDQAYYINKRFKEKYELEDIQRIAVYDDDYYVISSDKLEFLNFNLSEEKILLNNIIVNTVFEDREKNIWVATRKRGLIKIFDDNLSIKSFKNNGQIITGIYSTESHILLLWDDKIEVRNANNTVEFEYDFQAIKKPLAEVVNNSFIIKDLDTFHIISPPYYNSNQDLFYRANSKAVEIKGSKLYMSADNIIHILEIEQEIDAVSLEFQKSIRIPYVYVLEYSRNRDLLLAGSTKGLYRIDENDNPSIYINKLSSANICDIEESMDSSLWVATRNEGIFRIKKDKVIKHFDTSNGLLSNVINDLQVQNGYVYAATTNGISQINIYTSTIINKNSVNGLPSDNITNLCIFNDSIWMAIQKDIVVVDSTFFKDENYASILSLHQFYCNNKNVEYKAGMKFNHDENKIDILLNNISLNSGSNKSIKYRIPNLDTMWTSSKESAIRLPVLQPGKYNIEVVGINGVGAESKTLDLFFEIKPPWWNTIWARILGVLILLGIVNSIIIYRGQRIRKEEALKRDYLSQINKIKDQALQLQMNPHFIFNSLNAIQGFIGTDEEEMAMNFLARFARLIRLIFEYSKGNTITLEEELEFIYLYLDLEKLRFKDRINIKVTIDPEVESIKDIVQVPPLLIQPIIENSFKHGLFHKKGKGNLHVDYSMKNDVLQVVIQDDGIGREQSKKIAQQNTEKQSSSGIKTTLERVDLLNFGKEEKDNSVVIEDLYHEDERAAGTRTVLTISV